MSSRHIVRITVFSQEQYGGDWPPVQAADFVAWFQGHVNGIPEQYRDTARIEIDSTSGWEDSHYARIEISYKRPETDEELSARRATERARISEQEEAEKRQLAALKKKYDE